MSGFHKLGTGLALALLLVGFLTGSPETASGRAPQATEAAHWFEGATLVIGDGTPPVENAAFLVEDGVFSWVGESGDRIAPGSATRVDLTGKTVTAAFIDAHQHIGLTDIKNGTHSKDNYTRHNLIEHLQRSAYHGVAVTMSLGLEADEALAFRLRDEEFSNAARFLTSGRGIAATPMAGPQQAYRVGIPRGALTESEGRAAVDTLDAHGVRLVKIWVDSRSGSTIAAAPSPSSRLRSTGPSSTKRTAAACRLWLMSGPRARWTTPNTSYKPASTASPTRSATETSTRNM